MSAKAKLDSSLSSLVAKLEKLDPAYEVAVVVTPASGADREAVKAGIGERGGSVREVRDDAVECVLPVGKIMQVADDGSISSIRMKRVHRMH